jgi:hypothetical protein
MTPRPFKTLFCERFSCSPQEYEERAFRRCLYRHAWFLAPIIPKFDPKFFREDFKFIGHLGQSVSVTDASIDVAEYGDLNRGPVQPVQHNFKTLDHKRADGDRLVGLSGNIRKRSRRLVIEPAS